MLKSPLRSLLSIASLAIFPGALSAQFGWDGPPMPLNETNWVAVLSPPPNTSGSTAKGRARFTLDPAANSLHYRIETNVANATIAQLRTGTLFFPPYDYPPPTVTISGEGGVFQGSLSLSGLTLGSTLLNTGAPSSLRVFVNVNTSNAPGVPVVIGVAELEVRRHLRATLTNSAGMNFGTANFELHYPEGLVTVRISTLLNSSSQAAIHIHDTWLSEPGPIVATIPAGAKVATIPPGVLSTSRLLSGYYDLDIHATSGWTIRGPIVKEPESFIVRATGGQAYPPNSSPYTAFGTLTFNPTTSQIAYSIQWNGPGSGTSAKIKTLTGDLVATLASAGPGTGKWEGSAPFTSYEALFDGRLCLTISYVNPSVDVRGRIEQNGRPFGWPSPTSAGILGRDLRIDQPYAPVLGGSWTVRLTGALPGAAVSLCVGTDTMFGSFGNGGGVLWIANGEILTTTANAEGAAQLAIPIPPNPALKGTPVFTQWVSEEPGAPYPGLVFSNAMYSVYP